MPTLIAVPIISAKVPLAAQVSAARQAGAQAVELRVDCVADVAAVERLLAEPRVVPLIVTVRRAEEGGAWTGAEVERIALLERLGLHGPGYVDVEYAAWRRSADARQRIGRVCGLASAEDARGRVRARNQLILSYHDLHGTPTDLEHVFDELDQAPADVIKAVFTARDATDALEVLVQLARRSPRRAVIALAMGEAGLVSRILAGKFGAFLTFAALEPGQESAPGQLTVDELCNLYRWNEIGSRTCVYGVVGWPVRHSWSPALHNAALRFAGVDGVYVPLPVRPAWEDFAAFAGYVTQHAELDVAGLSITVPHKEHALRWLTERGFCASEVARRCGAVNTLTRGADGTWAGDNTDVCGVRFALRGVVDQVRGARVAVLGAGGVARAVIVALQELACDVTIFNRSPQRAARVAHELRCTWQPWGARNRYAGAMQVNCTSLGLWPATESTPLDEDRLRAGTIVFDTVYRPAETRLLRAARARGGQAVDGVEMFIGQAAAQFERWHGGPAPREVMETLVRSLC